MPVRMKWFYKWNCQPLYFSYAKCRRETQFAFIHLFPLATMWWTALSLPLFFNTSRIEANKPEEVASSGNGGYFEWWNSHLTDTIGVFPFCVRLLRDRIWIAIREAHEFGETGKQSRGGSGWFLWSGLCRSANFKDSLIWKNGPGESQQYVLHEFGHSGMRWGEIGLTV